MIQKVLSVRRPSQSLKMLTIYYNKKNHKGTETNNFDSYEQIFRGKKLILFNKIWSIFHSI